MKEFKMYKWYEVKKIGKEIKNETFKEFKKFLVIEVYKKNDDVSGEVTEEITQLVVKGDTIYTDVAMNSSCNKIATLKIDELDYVEFEEIKDEKDEVDIFKFDTYVFKIKEYIEKFEPSTKLDKFYEVIKMLGIDEQIQIQFEKDVKEKTRFETQQIMDLRSINESLEKQNKFYERIINHMIK